MKRFILIFLVALIASALGSLIGYSLAKRSQPTSNREYYLLHEGLDRQAHVYMRFLQAQDSADPARMIELRRHALGTLQVYLQQVDDMRNLGFEWAPFDDRFYASAREYVASDSKQD